MQLVGYFFTRKDLPGVLVYVTQQYYNGYVKALTYPLDVDRSKFPEPPCMPPLPAPGPTRYYAERAVAGVPTPLNQYTFSIRGTLNRSKFKPAPTGDDMQFLGNFFTRTGYPGELFYVYSTYANGSIAVKVYPADVDRSQFPTAPVAKPLPSVGSKKGYPVGKLSGTPKPLRHNTFRIIGAGSRAKFIPAPEPSAVPTDPYALLRKAFPDGAPWAVLDAFAEGQPADLAEKVLEELLGRELAGVLETLYPEK